MTCVGRLSVDGTLFPAVMDQIFVGDRYFVYITCVGRRH